MELISQAKPGKKEMPTIAKFKEGAGVMNPGCWCKAHDLEGRVIYDSHEIDPEQNEVSCVVFEHRICSSYPRLPCRYTQRHTSPCRPMMIPSPSFGKLAGWTTSSSRLRPSPPWISHAQCAQWTYRLCGILRPGSWRTIGWTSMGKNRQSRLERGRKGGSAIYVGSSLVVPLSVSMIFELY